MVLNPEVGKEYEWRRSDKKTRRVRVAGLVYAGPDVLYGNPTGEIQPGEIQTYPDPTTRIVELVQAVIVDEPETEEVVDSIPKEQLYEIE